MAVRCSKRPASARRQVLHGYRRYGYYPYRGYYWRPWYYRPYYYGYCRPYRYGYWRRPYYRVTGGPVGPSLVLILPS